MPQTVSQTGLTSDIPICFSTNKHISMRSLPTNFCVFLTGLECKEKNFEEKQTIWDLWEIRIVTFGYDNFNDTFLGDA